MKAFVVIFLLINVFMKASGAEDIHRIGTQEEECPSLEGDMDLLTQEQFVARLTHSCRYDKLIKPETADPLKIYIQLDVRHIETIEQLQFRTHMLVHYRYIDSRLAFSDISPNRVNIQGEEHLREAIWVPHIVLRNERKTQIMGLESKDTFISINPEGEVIFSYRMSATIYCWMNLKKFPFDMQDCDINMISWAYNATYLELVWEEGVPVKIAPQLHLTEFKMTSYHIFQTVVSSSLTHSAFVGNYSSIIFNFVLQREIGFYLLTYYIPSIMLVCTSWVTFYLQADASPPRAVLGTSTMLTFITLSAGQTRNLPKVSYIKFSEIWFLGIAVFIFASMAEFALVNMVWRRSKNIELKKKTSKYILKSSITPRTARKDFERSISSLNLPQIYSSSSLNGDSDGETSQRYRNYLTVHDYPSLAGTSNAKEDEEQPRKRAIWREELPKSPIMKPKGNLPEPEKEKAKEVLSLAGWTTMTPHETANWIDKRSRIVFPVAFIIFNVLYWSFVYIF